jgi:UDP-N-acetylglucosamine 2-epimerase (non-hydrolysing)
MYSPFPEEFNRKTISSMATYHFAPTENNRRNLLNEGMDNSRIFVTGNTVIDSLGCMWIWMNGNDK